MVNSILGSGVLGIQRGIEGVRRDAQTIASSVVKQDGGGVADLAAPLIDLKVNLHQVQASARVVETVDEILTFLLRSTSEKR